MAGVKIPSTKTSEAYQGGLLQATAAKKKADDLSVLSGYQYGATALSELANAGINYSLLEMREDQEENTAQSIELQAKEQANQIRELFNETVGNAVFASSRRGVKTGEGSIATNIEQSSADLGEDIKKTKENAAAKAARIRAQSKVNKRLGKVSVAQGLLGAASSATTSYGLLK